MKYKPEHEQALVTELMDPQIADDLERFVLFAYPWGREGTPLQNVKGPRTWQRDYLQAVTDHIKKQRTAETLELPLDPWRHATASGRGPGKSSLVAWLTDWFMSTRLGSTTIITANTETQMKTKTYAEIGKWTTLLINAHWFETSVLAVRPAEWFRTLISDQLKIDCQYYYAQGQLWSEENPDAFAGAHNPHGMQVIFDEASGIPVSIFTVTEGFFTEKIVDRYWHVFSNPRRNSGGFFECFHQNRAYWRLQHLDSRAVTELDQTNFDRMIQQYGIESDTVRVEILGKFPKQGVRQFISNSLVEEAQRRVIEPDDGAPLIMGVDIARYGDDKSVFRWRRGRDARSIPPVRFENRDNMFIANQCAHWIDKTHPDAVNVDAGNGTGVIDRLREMGYKVHEVWFGSGAESKEWANKRTEMYADMRDWLGGGAIDSDPRLFHDLTAPEYDYFGKASDSIMLESKEAMKDRGEPSPDDGDSLALTFARRVSRRDSRTFQHRNRNRLAQDVDYELFS